MRAIVFDHLPAMVLATSIAALTSGCQIYEAYKDERRSQALENTVKLYVKAVRWGEFGAAAGLVRARDGTYPEMDLEALADVRVVRSDHTLAATSPKDTEAEMYASYQYYRDESAVVHTISQQGTWWYAFAEARWYFDGGLPQFSEN